MTKFGVSALFAIALGLYGCQQSSAPNLEGAEITEKSCELVLRVLGTAQDAGKPQIGKQDDPAWNDISRQRYASSLGVVDITSGTSYLFDATPDIKFQLQDLETAFSGQELKLNGVFLTHAHIGHYLGLAMLGREAMGAKSIPVYAMPKMKAYLETNGPWDQLVKINNIALSEISDGAAISLPIDMHVIPFLVPHRDEYAETVGYKIAGKQRSVIYLPDIDSWEKWDALGGSIEELIEQNDILFLDATFFSGDELPGRDMSKIPHPTISHSMKRFSALSNSQRGKIKFIHLNHSNPAHDLSGSAAGKIRENGYGLAHRGDSYCLSLSP